MRTEQQPEVGGVDALTKLRGAELIRIKEEHGEKLLAEDVVETAKDAKNVLHSCFEWNNKIAGHEYRLMQARKLIKIHFTILEQAPNSGRVTEWVSLTEDRKQDGGGYRMMVDVLEDTELRSQLLRDAKRDFLVWKAKYQHLVELAGIFAAGAEVFPAEEPD
jgi:hypothetical protein